MFRVIGITSFINIISLVFTLLLSILTARVLLDDGKGIVALFSLSSSLILAISTLGAGSSATYHLSQKTVLPITVIKILMTASILGAMIVLLVDSMGFGYLLLGENLDAKYIILLVFCIFSGSFSQYAAAKTLSEGKYVKNALISLFVIFLYIVVTAILMISSISQPIATYLYISATIFASIIGSILLLIQGKNVEKPIYNKIVKISTFFKYGFKSFLTDFVQLLSYRIDIFVVLYFLNTGAVGQYSLAVGLSQMFWFLPKIIASFVFPEVARQKLQINKAVQLARVSFCITGFFGVLATIIIPPIIPILWGTAFANSSGAFIALMPGVLLLVPGFILTSVLAGRDFIQYNLLGSILGLVVGITLDLLLIPKMGILGAALATSAGYFATLIVAVYYFCIKFQVRAIDIFLIKSDDVSLIVEKLKLLKLPIKN